MCISSLRKMVSSWPFPTISSPRTTGENNNMTCYLRRCASNVVDIEWHCITLSRTFVRTCTPTGEVLQTSEYPKTVQMAGMTECVCLCCSTL